MRISDWSSDVYSSDLHGQERFQHDVSTARLPDCCVAATKRRFASHSVNGKCNAAGSCRTLRQRATRSEEHTSELQSLMRNSYAVLCFKQITQTHIRTLHIPDIQDKIKYNNLTRMNP